MGDQPSVEVLGVGRSTIKSMSNYLAPPNWIKINFALAPPSAASYIPHDSCSALASVSQPGLPFITYIPKTSKAFICYVVGQYLL
jgi:hypothetical protein